MLAMLGSSQKLGLEGDIVFHYEWACNKVFPNAKPRWYGVVL